MISQCPAKYVMLKEADAQTYVNNYTSILAYSICEVIILLDFLMNSWFSEIDEKCLSIKGETNRAAPFLSSFGCLSEDKVNTKQEQLGYFGHILARASRQLINIGYMKGFILVIPDHMRESR